MTITADMPAPIVRPPMSTTTEHLFTPAVWVSFKDGEWQARIDWSDCFQYSYDHSIEQTIDDPEIAPDAEYASQVLDRMIKTGIVPSDSDNKDVPPLGALPVNLPDMDEMEFWA